MRTSYFYPIIYKNVNNNLDTLHKPKHIN